MRHNQKSALQFAIIAALLLAGILAFAAYTDPTEQPVQTTEEAD